MAQAALRTQDAALRDLQCVTSSAALHVRIYKRCCHPLQAVLQPAAEDGAEALSAAAVRAMASVASAWAAQGFPEQELVDACVGGSRAMPQDARASLLQALSAALPAVRWNDSPPALGTPVPRDACIVPDIWPLKDLSGLLTMLRKLVRTAVVSSDNAICAVPGVVHAARVPGADARGCCGRVHT